MLCHVTITNLSVLYNQKTDTSVLSHLCLQANKNQGQHMQNGENVIFKVCIYLCRNMVLAGIEVCLSSRSV